MESIADELARGGRHEFAMSSNAQLSLAVAMVVLVFVLWRIAMWRRSVEREYERVQLYEDRPFAWGALSQGSNDGDCVSPACSVLPRAGEMTALGALDDSETKRRSDFESTELQYDDVQEMQRLIKDALEERSPSGDNSRGARPR
jgi:hypothetical protein